MRQNENPWARVCCPQRKTSIRRRSSSPVRETSLRVKPTLRPHPLPATWLLCRLPWGKLRGGTRGGRKQDWGLRSAVGGGLGMWFQAAVGQGPSGQDGGRETHSKLRSGGLDFRVVDDRPAGLRRSPPEPPTPQGGSDSGPQDADADASWHFCTLLSAARVRMRSTLARLGTGVFQRCPLAGEWQRGRCPLPQRSALAGCQRAARPPSTPAWQGRGAAPQLPRFRGVSCVSVRSHPGQMPRGPCCR